MLMTVKKPPPTPMPAQLSYMPREILHHVVQNRFAVYPDYGRFNLILWGSYVGMRWKGLRVAQNPDGAVQIHDATVDKAFARWTHDGSIEYAVIPSVGEPSDHHQLDLSILYDDRIDAVAQTSGDGGRNGGASARPRGEQVIAVAGNHGCV